MRFLFLLLSFCSIGCVTSNTDVEGRDSGLFLPSIRATFGERDHHGSRLAPARGELELAVVGGEDSQTLVAGERVIFDSRLFDGPARLEHDWELLHLGLNGYGAIPLGEYVQLGMMAGLTFNSLGIRVQSETRSEREHTISVGPGLGLRLAIAPTDWLTIYGQAMSYYALSDHTEVELQTAEVGAHFHVHEQVGLILGWRMWEYDAETTEETIIGLVETEESDIELENHGFMASLVFSF